MDEIREDKTTGFMVWEDVITQNETAGLFTAHCTKVSFNATMNRVQKVGSVCMCVKCFKY